MQLITVDENRSPCLLVSCSSIVIINHNKKGKNNKLDLDFSINYVEIFKEFF